MLRRGTGDFADLFLLENDGATRVRMTKLAKRHAFCGTSGGQQCNFDAAGGA